MYKMSKDAMKERIQEALKGGKPEEIQRRIEVCLWGLGKSKGGALLANELIEELSLEKYGAKKLEIPAV